MKLAWLIGFRYVRARRGGLAISLFSLISILSIALGIMALIVVMSVMNGVTSEVRDKILSMTAHAKILAADGFANQTDIRPVIAASPEAKQHVIASAPYVEGEAVITLGEGFLGIRLKGIDPKQELAVSDALQPIADKISNLQANRFQVIIGQLLANRLGLSLGDKITLIIPQFQIGATGILPRIKRVTVAGIFESGHYVYDSNMMFTHWQDAQTLFQKTVLDGFQLKLDDLMTAQSVTDSLRQHFQDGEYALNWGDENRAYFDAVKVEKGAMFLILLIILVVATFNIVATLTMMVSNKTGDIAILRTLGISRFGISRIFMVQGILLGALGTFFGVVFGVLLARNVPNLMRLAETQWGLRLPQELYFISALNPKIDSSFILTVSVISLGLSLLAALLPAYIASQVQPARALAYE